MTIVDVVESSLRFVVNIFSQHLKFVYTVVRVLFSSHLLDVSINLTSIIKCLVVVLVSIPLQTRS